MPRTKSLILAALLGGLVFSQAVTAEWVHYANGVSRADSAKTRHPGTATLWTLTPTKVANPTVCSMYESNHPLMNRGRIMGTARIDRADGSTEMLAFRSKVNGNFSVGCQPAAAAIDVGDLVTFALRFKGLPKQVLSGARSDFFSVHGVVSDLGAPGPRLIPPGIDPPASGGQVYASISMFAADHDRQRHPKKFSQWVVMPTDAASPVICSALGNIATRPNKGRVITAVEVMHVDGRTSSMSFNGRVAGNVYSECQFGPDLAAGDVVRFDYIYKRLPKLKVEGAFVDVVATYGVISPNGVATRRTGSERGCASISEER